MQHVFDNWGEVSRKQEGRKYLICRVLSEMQLIRLLIASHEGIQSLR
jgi:hypothetical protein